MTDEFQCPAFEEAVVRFQQFLRGQGWPEAILWLNAACIVRQPGQPPLVGHHGSGDGYREAEGRYERGRSKKLGVLLEAVCTLAGRSCATVCAPSEAAEAEYLMYPSDGGLKLSVAVPRTEGVLR